MTGNMPEVGGALKPHQLEKYIDLLGAVLVPPGDRLLYVANTRDGLRACDEGAIWTIETDGSNARVLIDQRGSQSKPAVAMDGRGVAYLRTLDERRQVWTHRLESGLPSRQLTSFWRGVGPIGPAWSPDGQLIAFDACDAPPRDKKAAYRVQRPIWRFEGLGLIEDALSEIFVVSAAGGTPQRLTHDDGVVTFLTWSPDGSQLLYGVFARPDSDRYEIKLVDYPSGRTRLVASERCLVYPPIGAWLPDGRVIYTSPWNINKQIDLLVFDPSTGKTQTLLTETAGQLFGFLQTGFNRVCLEPRIVVGSDGEAYGCLQRGGSLITVKVDSAGVVEELTDTSSSSVPLDLCGDKLVMARMSAALPLDVYMLELQTRTERQVTGLNRHWLAEPPFSVQQLHFTSADSTTELEGWYLEPPGAARPLPTILNIHGGPFAAHGQAFSLDNVLFTSAGYGVLSVNYRGGSGYGDEFAANLDGDLGRCDMEDLLQGVDLAVQRGLADAERLVSFGLSGGGFLTAWLVAHTERFKAGIAECLVSDWNGMIASDIPRTVAIWMGSDPGGGEAAMARFAKVAPSTYALNCSTPLLLVAHDSDLRCPASQAEILFNELRLAGKTVEMLRLPNVGHTPYSAGVSLRTERATTLLDWIEAWLDAEQ